MTAVATCLCHWLNALTICTYTSSYACLVSSAHFLHQQASSSSRLYVVIQRWLAPACDSQPNSRSCFELEGYPDVCRSCLVFIIQLDSQQLPMNFCLLQLAIKHRLFSLDSKMVLQLKSASLIGPRSRLLRDHPMMNSVLPHLHVLYIVLQCQADGRESYL